MYFVERCIVCDSTAIDQYQALVMPFVSHITGLWIPYKIESGRYRDLDCGTSYLGTYSCECKSCCLLFSKHRFDAVETGKLYRGYRDHTYNNIRSLYEPNYAATSHYLTKEVKHLGKTNELLRSISASFRRVLDWGGGDGLNTPLKSTADYISIYDISSNNEQIVILNKRGEQEPEKWDLVSFSHVLEHLSDPMSEIREALKLLDKGGHLFIEVPLEREVQLGIRKYHWHEHINCFSKKSLEALLSKAGLELVFLETLDTSDNFREYAVIQCVARLRTNAKLQ
jgi:hypothetical protein